jgi:carboxymethylenebutenolidase
MSEPEIDPVRSTSLELNRRAFVGISAAATVAVGTPAHPPSVPENDPAISVERVTLTQPGVSIDAYAASPAGAPNDVPSVVVTMHVWGVDESIRDTVRRLAKAGFAAIAPDLYARLRAPSGDGVTDIAVFRPFAKNLERAQYTGDLRAGADWLKQKFPSTKAGIIGFCMGGRMAMLAAIDDAGTFEAVCPFYGPLKDVEPSAMHVPICGSYGARDTGIPPDDVRAFAAALHVPNDFKIYDNAGHAFCDEQRASFVPSACADAWKRATNFLTLYLGPTS